MSNHNEISSFIWKVCDDLLRDVFKNYEYGDIILPFLVLRRLDCVLEPKKKEVVEFYNSIKGEFEDPSEVLMEQTNMNFTNYSKFDLVKLKEDPNKLKIHIDEYISGYSSNVREILSYHNLNSIINKLHKNNRLFKLIELFTQVDLHPNVVNNHTMGQIFEELLRRFSEMSNETSGEHYTPRDIVSLLVSLVFSPDKDKLQERGKIISVFDPCCGTGGMLTVGKEWVHDNINKDISVNLFGQELNETTYSICKSDFLITGENPNNIKLGSSLSQDGFPETDRRFDYMITNPPFGVSWKSEKSFIEDESQRGGRFNVGTPKVTDGSLLFIQHMISKMETQGSRIGVVLNGSPLFTGDSGSGESEIRKWIIENDWLETIISLPNEMFFNTKIPTYIWIVTNKKKPKRKGKIQLIDSSSIYTIMKKSLGDKRKYISVNQTDNILKLYNDFEENDYSKIFDNSFFGFTRVKIERPKRNNGNIIYDKKGNPKSDSKLTDYERIPLINDVEDFLEKKSNLSESDSWRDKKNDLVGYSINFRKQFKKYKPLEDFNSVDLKIDKIDENIKTLKNSYKQNISKIKSDLDKIKLKKSGVEWIGEIPNHWSIKRLKDIGTFYGGLSGKKGGDFKQDDNINNKPYVPYTNIYNNTFISKEHFDYVVINPNENQNRVKKNDIFFLMSSETHEDLGKTCILIDDVDELYLNSFCKGFRIHDENIIPLFINYQLLGHTFKELISVEGRGFTRINLRQDDVKDLSVYIPPLKEQKEIVSFLKEQEGVVNEIIQLEEEKITYLKNLYNSFHSDLSSGKILL